MYHEEALKAHAQGEGHSQGSKGKFHVCDFSKSTKANLIKFHKKVKGNENVSQTK